MTHSTRIASNPTNRVNIATNPHSFNNKSPIKKLTIKNYKEIPSLPANFEEESLQKLEAAVKAIFTKNPINENKNILYNFCKDLCSQKFSSEMFQRLSQIFESHLTNLSKKMIELSNQLDSDSFLFEFNNCWLNHCEQLQMIRNIFIYLDRTYVIQYPEIKSIWDFGLSLFSTKILNLSLISDKLISKNSSFN